MIPMHLSASTPSTSTPNGKMDVNIRNPSVGSTIRYVYPMPLVGTVPMRIRVRPQIPMDDGIRFEALSVGPRSTVIDPRRFASRPTTVAARKRREPLRTPIFDMIQHTPSRHESTYEETSQFNPAQLDTVSISARRNSQSRASHGNASNAGGAMVMYDQQPQSMYPGGFMAPYEAYPVPAPPPPAMWYAPPPPPPFWAMPQPLDAKTMRKMMKQAMEAEKRYQSKNKPSECTSFCCGGAAALFWILLILLILGAIAVMVVALIYI